MVLIKVHNSFIQEVEMFDALCDSFDRMEVVEKDTYRNVTTFRVSNDEVPTEDVVIDPLFIAFDGVRPFVIEW